MAHTYNSSIQEIRQENGEFEANIGYTVTWQMAHYPISKSKHGGGGFPGPISDSSRLPLTPEDPMTSSALTCMPVVRYINSKHTYTYIVLLLNLFCQYCDTYFLVPTLKRQRQVVHTSLRPPSFRTAKATL